MDMALFYDAGKVAADRSSLDFEGLEHDFGVGLRVHGPLTTPIRIDLAKGREGFRIVWAGSAVF
jgi:outer membrane translocation and assembly module TamA